MAVAISVPTVNETTRSQVRAATWSSASAGIALAATIPLTAMIVRPLSQLMFVRGTDFDGNWGRAFMMTFVILAPMTYLLFFATAGELLKTRVAKHVHKMTMRVAAVGMVPYIVLMIAARIWSDGPQHSFMIAAALTIPIGMASTIWASTQNHD